MREEPWAQTQRDAQRLYPRLSPHHLGASLASLAQRPTLAPTKYHASERPGGVSPLQDAENPAGKFKRNRVGWEICV